MKTLVLDFPALTPFEERVGGVYDTTKPLIGICHKRVGLNDHFMQAVTQLLFVVGTKISHVPLFFQVWLVPERIIGERIDRRGFAVGTSSRILLAQRPQLLPATWRPSMDMPCVVAG